MQAAFRDVATCSLASSWARLFGPSEQGVVRDEIDDGRAFAGLTIYPG